MSFSHSVLSLASACRIRLLRLKTKQVRQSQGGWSLWDCSLYSLRHVALSWKPIVFLVFHNHWVVVEGKKYPENGSISKRQVFRLKHCLLRNFGHVYSHTEVPRKKKTRDSLSFLRKLYGQNNPKYSFPKPVPIQISQQSPGP